MSTVANDDVVTIRSALLPTTSYVDSSTFSLYGNQRGFTLELTIVKESTTSIEWKLMASKDGGTTWVNMTEKAVSAGVTTASLATGTIACAALASTDRVAVEFNRSAYSMYKFQFKGTGTLTSATLAAVVRKYATST